MVHAVVRRRHQDPVQHAHAAHHLRVHPELVDQVYRVHRHEDLERITEEEQRHVENPAEHEPGAGLPQRRRQVVVLALVVHRVRGPEDGDLVTVAMEPVVAEVPGECGRHPQRDAARRGVEPGKRHIDQREILEHEAPGDERQQLREITDRRAQRPGAEAVDRVVGTIQPGAAGPVYRQFAEQCQQEERYGQCDQVHREIVTGPIMRSRAFLR
jgi:hypothetical protein